MFIGDTPLFWAARNGHSQLIKYMTKYRLSEVSKQNKSLETALHTSVRYLQTESALALLEAGANVDIQDEVSLSFNGAVLSGFVKNPRIIYITFRAVRHPRT